MADFSIKDLEILSGIKAHTIRIWEHRYTLLKPLRSKTNIRSYSLPELETILNISLLKNHGFKISRINKMTLPQMQSSIEEIFPAGNEDYILNKLFIKLFSLDMTGFENVLDECIARQGIDAAIEKVLDKFLQKTELLRTHSHFKDEFNYLMKSIIRQKIIAGINTLQPVYQNKKTIISFLPENHYSEIELLYMQYLLKKEGLNILYLGVNVPVKDVVLIAMQQQPDFIYLYADVSVHNFHADKFLKKIAQQFSTTRIVITGGVLQRYTKHAPENIFIHSSAKEALQFMA